MEAWRNVGYLQTVVSDCGIASLLTKVNVLVLHTGRRQLGEMWVNDDLQVAYKPLGVPTVIDGRAAEPEQAIPQSPGTLACAWLDLKPLSPG